MKITTNFVVSPKRLARPMAILSWGLAGLAAAAALWLTLAATEARHEIPALRERLAQLEQRQREIAPPEIPPVAELQALKRRVAELNALSAGHGRTAASLLADLERWLPDQAWLASLHAKTRGGEALIVAESENIETLTAFLLRLEQQPRFSEVLLVKQTPRSAQRRSVQFEIRLKERS